MAYRCPQCDAPVLVRRLGYCPSCREELPEEMKLSSQRVAQLDREEFEESQKRLKQLSEANHKVIKQMKSLNNPYPWWVGW